MIVFLVAACFSSVLLCMEDGYAVRAHKSSKGPNKHLTLEVMKAAKVLRDGVPQKWIPSDETVKFCKENGIDALGAYGKNKAIQAALKFFFGTVERPIFCPYASIFARDSSTFFASNPDKQYIGRHHAIQALNEERLCEGKLGVAAPPTFSPNGRWLVGWEAYNKLAIRDLDRFVDAKARDCPVDDTWDHQKGVISDKPIAYLSWPEEKDSKDYTTDYALDNETIVVQKGADLFCGALDDVAQKGIKALQKVYTDSQSFQAPQRYKVIHILSDGSVASIGQDAIRVFDSVDGTWACIGSYPIKLAADDMVVVNAHRGVAAVTKKGKYVRFYALIGFDTGKKRRIKVENLMPESCAFSPAGLMFVLQQDAESCPEIFNCTRLKKNSKVQTCTVNNFQLALPATWNTQGIIGYHTNSRDDVTKAFIAEDLSMLPVKAMSILNTSRGFSILEGYLLHKETQRENGKAEQQE